MTPLNPMDRALTPHPTPTQVFLMGGRVVFSKTYAPSVLYAPDTHVAVQAWGDVDALTMTSIDVFSMGCGWTDPPYQPEPTMESITRV